MSQRTRRPGARARGMVAALAAVFVLGGCSAYHAVIETGVQPGPRTVKEEWAMGYFGGLVAPDRVDAGEACGESGVARVETKHSYLNQVVAGLTFGIFTPMEIVVTCGAGARVDGDGGRGGVEGDVGAAKGGPGAAER